MIKKPIAILSVAAMALCLFGCSAKTASGTSGKDYSNTTVTGKVSAVEGTSVTLLLGEISRGKGGGTAPSGDNKSGKKTSDASVSPTAVTTAAAETALTASTLASAESSAAPGSTAPSGENAKGGAPGGRGGETFTAGEDSITINVSSSVAVTLEKDKSTGSISDIAVGDIVEVTFGDSSAVKSVAVKNVGGDMGNKGGPGGGQAPGGDSSTANAKQS